MNYNTVLNIIKILGTYSPKVTLLHLYQDDIISEQDYIKLKRLV